MLVVCSDCPTEVSGIHTVKNSGYSLVSWALPRGDFRTVAQTGFR